MDKKINVFNGYCIDPWRFATIFLRRLRHKPPQNLTIFVYCRTRMVLQFAFYNASPVWVTTVFWILFKFTCTLRIRCVFFNVSVGICCPRPEAGLRRIFLRRQQKTSTPRRIQQEYNAAGSDRRTTKRSGGHRPSLAPSLAALPVDFARKPTTVDRVTTDASSASDVRL